MSPESAPAHNEAENRNELDPDKDVFLLVGWERLAGISDFSSSWKALGAECFFCWRKEEEEEEYDGGLPRRIPASPRKYVPLP